jgi:hypothetical protein
VLFLLGIEIHHYRYLFGVGVCAGSALSLDIQYRLVAIGLMLTAVALTYGTRMLALWITPG